MKIEVLKDTTVVEENTADSLAVILTKEDSVTEYETDDGKVIKGENLIVEEKSSTNLGVLKSQRDSIQSKIDDLIIEKASVQALIDVVQPEIDKAIEEILIANPK